MARRAGTQIQSGRAQDLADAARMLGLAPEEERKMTRGLFTRYLPDAVEDLENLITLGTVVGIQDGKQSRGVQENAY